MLLMYGDRRHPRLLVKCVFDAVAVMRVEVEVHDALTALPQHRHDGEHGVVEVTESGGTIGSAMMRAAGRMKHHVPRRCQLGGKDRTADGHRRTLEEAREKRVLEGSDLVTLTNDGCHRPCGVCVLKRPNIGAIMKLKELLDAGRFAVTKVGCIEPAQYAEEIEHGSMTNNIEWVVETERRVAINVTANKQR